MIPMTDYETEESEDESPESAKRLYELGQELMDMALAQGYSPDSEEPEDEMGGEEEAVAPKKKGKDKVKIALGFFGK